jgi:TM2 domain-containing membrane protein YozV
MIHKLLCGGLLFVMAWLPHQTAAQTDQLCDPTEAVRFADYLMKTRQYKIATWELERLDFIQPGVDSVRLRLLDAKRLDGAYLSGIMKLRSYLSDSPQLLQNPDFAQAYVRLNFLFGEYDGVRSFLQQNSVLPPAYRANVMLASAILMDDFAAARSLSQTETITPSLLQVVSDAEAIRMKSPFLAGTLSALVPGTGKFYTGDWKDGIISMVFVGANAFAAYRGFNQEGVQSVYGWVFSAIGTGFYVGNIYGSVKSARKRNTMKKQRIYDQVHLGIGPFL